MILPDTHALIWFLDSNPRLGPTAARRIIEANELSQAAFSAISVWEVALLQAKGRLDRNVSAVQWRQNLLRAGFIEMPVDGLIAARSVALSDFHDDPADRIIMATAQEGHQLITDDRQILDSSGPLERFPAGQSRLNSIFRNVLTCHDPLNQMEAVGHGRTTQNNYSRSFR